MRPKAINPQIRRPRAGLLVGLIALLATSSCQDRSLVAAAANKALDANSLRTDGASRHARQSRPIRLAHGDPQQFDLVCRYEGRRLARGWGCGSPCQMEWSGELQISVDLETMQFCEPQSCSLFGGPKPIAAVDETTITFYDQMENGVRTVDTVSRLGGRYLRRLTARNGADQLSTGTCHRRPFSGFPQ